MALIFPDLENIQRLKVSPTLGELALVNCLKQQLDDSYEVFFNPYLDGDRPDIIILKEHCCVFVIEVKDWNLRNYRVTKKNKWEVYSKNRYSRKLSPQSQAFRYKKNLYDLHLPIVGLRRIINPNFFTLVHCFVYFHGSNKSDIDILYSPAIAELKEEQSRLNQSFRKNKIEFQYYEKGSQSIDRFKKNIQRDRSMSFSEDKIDTLINRIKQSSKHVLFDEDVYLDFKRRLSPSEHVVRQGIIINFNKKQLAVSTSKEGKEKIKGVAGCGKTSILAQRAINAYRRHNSTVLILTFNITLKNYIRDKISDFQGERNFSHYEISNYHQFFNSQINNANGDLEDLIERYGLKELYRNDVFRDRSVEKYQTILIDEIQDYESEWVKIIRDRFLAEKGEMILFGDESQNIYKREVARSPVIAQGFGRWIKLSRSYRTNIESPLNQLFRDFQTNYLIQKHSDAEIIDVSAKQIGIGFDLLRYEKISTYGWKDSLYNSISKMIKAYDLHPNDIVILTSKIYVARELNELWVKIEKTHCMFETYEELAKCTATELDELKQMNEREQSSLVYEYKTHIESIRRSKKNHFYANSGLIKLSTIHSYKGLESKTVFYIMDEQDSPEVVYTSITRSNENLVVLDVGGKNLCSEFLEASINSMN